MSGALPPEKIVLSETIICASVVDAARRNLAALLAAAVMGYLFSVVDDSDRIFSQRQIVVDSTRCVMVNEST